MKKIIYTPEEEVSTEIEKIVSMFELGADFLYLRKPNKDISYWYAYVEQFPYGKESKMITSDFKLLHDLKLGGFHFKREMLKSLSKKDLSENLRMLKESNFISSGTAHDLSELKKMDGQFDIILISPLFDSISKKEYLGNWDLDNLKTLIDKRTSKTSLLIGQSGINNQNISIIQSLGLDGYALLGYLWNTNDDIIQKFKQICHGGR